MAPNVDELRSQYEDSLLSVARSMRNAAKAAEDFANAITNAPLINGHVTGKTGDEETVNGKRKRSKKDPNAPKRPASSFFLFQNEIRPKVKEQHPDLPSADLRRLMSEQWAQLPEEQKNHFKQKADELKVAYSEEKEKYNARSPEEVAAADAAVAAAAATKKTPKSRKPAAAPVVAKKPALSPVTGSEESDIQSSEDEKVKTKPGKPIKPVPPSSRKAPKSDPVVPDSDEDDEDEDEDSDHGKESSDEEEEEEEDEQPPAKKSKSKHYDKLVSKRK
ncbi:high mobility group box domain-containing protein [Lentinula aciculospora]|uniref:High mobility group box domain-containing protein n=1 Tax=Lentinula aciculospora TaxID=153920 RepID=A0A9W9A1R0_9AGAR|nr:high mobility group box domain-containing protein [Lentinula aciculospora]